jgi:hypothetical protein
MGSGKASRRRIGVSLGISVLRFAIFSSDAGAAPADLQKILAQFDATVLPPQERQAAARMIEENVQRRLRESNERSSAEWRNITSRAEWEQFRAAKVTGSKMLCFKAGLVYGSRPTSTGQTNRGHQCPAFSSLTLTTRRRSMANCKTWA